MRIDALDLDKQELIRRLNAEYGFEIEHLVFQPKGEDSYGYRAESGMGKSYFLKVYDAGRPPNLEDRLRVAHDLRAHCGLPFVVAAHITRPGRLLCELPPYAAATFDFVEGASAYEGGLAETDSPRLAGMLASLHASVRCPFRTRPSVERFGLPFRATLLAVLEAAEDKRPAANDYQRELRGRLLQERADVLETVERVDRLAEFAREADAEPALTHGDPTSGNVIKDRWGELHLIDWDDVAIGPPERDLVYFTGEGFEAFLGEYVRALGRRPRLHGPIFEFYMVRWVLQEIADYGSRILLETLDEVENEHARAELEQYVPIQHAGMQAALREIEATLNRSSM